MFSNEDPGQEGAENDDVFIEMLDEFSNDVPGSFFEREPTKDTTTARTMHFLLKSIVGQLKNPINTEAEAIAQWLIYKQTGPHRHQKFFGHFRQMSRLVKKYNEMSLIKRLNPQLRKAENCGGDDVYKLEIKAVRYMGCAYVKRVYLLERIRESCVKCADGAIGLLEIDHWINLSLVIVALCSQIHSEVVAQVLEMEKVYKIAAGVMMTADLKFPKELNDLEVVRKIRHESRIFDERRMETSNLTAISRLLKYNAETMKQAQTENDLRMKTSEVLTDILAADLSSPISTQLQKKKTNNSVQMDMSDLGISISREDMSFLNTTGQSCSSIPEIESDEDAILFSPNLFASKSIKIKNKLKRMNPVAESSTKITKTTSFLSATMDILNSSQDAAGLPRKKKKKMNKK
ncbi:Nucleolus and neural progenitor protein-like N-terminal domain-containing protein [Caenorhabditis elegans]|uniref:Nucleolus and neural progenitor protein-like N-terminal domain-containing protein n=1 Tax=Caenorhabditis elegans TaxID=6239 RepID=P91078_CAEEL|nr:Nucleolus and neural progenitor protein-like N-terminal domain-containing protein [Caenorhabditis elegans]CCD65325.1 Nucleolus and neural progenitor protein-like N-terminal domain-containing protein [Caenorhabditis elegans]|eukprot:NP_493647.1 Uncharacterized protein CELE_C23H3.5 [Caenorhabditis elegans]